MTHAAHANTPPPLLPTPCRPCPSLYNIYSNSKYCSYCYCYCYSETNNTAFSFFSFLFFSSGNARRRAVGALGALQPLPRRATPLSPQGAAHGPSRLQPAFRSVECTYLEVRPSPDRSPQDPSVEKHSVQGAFAEHTELACSEQGRANASERSHAAMRASSAS
ncbi:hypothetical protein T492DRAFT_46886 [Pavlovales sp. CCMP2436]|nr:hypothetical protein T492DRAFT_46886 [Pavlovales sp. CCMP2436]